MTALSASALDTARAILAEDMIEGPYLQNISPEYLAGLLKAALAEEADG